MTVGVCVAAGIIAVTGGILFVSLSTLAICFIYDIARDYFRRHKEEKCYE